ncbi:MAG TPA: PfkB family carbohydrate kinase [Candidatus Paceibacterota bacterium]|nr:PfkB family carbohydrate kinase [Verrucomicrobiota bacterium]HRZ44312.1 PfkB family carbohydrate kinase [Candidatus Paceibacterota bacterium]HRZ93281.1 PfkB family carbohydrate kinase [Candidatus Paceibacterota bacterium]
MKPERFQAITARYAQLRIALIGDYCLDRYLEIDPARAETSIETGLAVHNVMRVRAQPGGAGTILNNLDALGIGRIDAVGFAGEDGEGWELCRALAGLPRVRLDHFLQTPDRRTFTYTKPLLMHPGRPPEEISRLDFKNWSPMPQPLESRFIDAISQLDRHVDAWILLEQVDRPGTGLFTDRILEALGRAAARPARLMIGDSRRGLRHFPPMTAKMNAFELARWMGSGSPPTLPEIQMQALHLARQLGHPVFVTLAELGLLGASPAGEIVHDPALPQRGPIDIVGAGDAVTANLAAALAAGATLREAVALANAAASIVIHQLGTTGAASIPQLAPLVG